VYDSNSDEKKINESIEKSIYKILEEHSNYLKNSNNKLNLAFFCTKQFLNEVIIKNVQKYKNKIIVDFIFDNAFPTKEYEYDLIIDLNFTECENLLRTSKLLRQYNLKIENNSYYSFIPEFKLEEIQRLILKENLHIKICNFLNEEFKEENDNSVKIANKDEFEIYDEIIDKLVYESKNSVHNRGISNLFHHFKRDDKIMEDMIFDYIYSNQKEIFDEKKFNYSLLTGKEGFISVRICLDNSSSDSSKSDKE